VCLLCGSCFCFCVVGGGGFGGRRKREILARFHRADGFGDAGWVSLTSYGNDVAFSVLIIRTRLNLTTAWWLAFGHEVKIEVDLMARYAAAAVRNEIEAAPWLTAGTPKRRPPKDLG